MDGIGANALDALLQELDRAIKQGGFIPRAGQIIDASLIAVLRQRISGGERAGNVAQEFCPNRRAKAAEN